MIRLTLAALVAGAGLALAQPALAAPAAPFTPHAVLSDAPALAGAPVIDVAGGCGPGFRPNRFGRCVPFGPRPFYRRGYGYRGGPVYRRGYEVRRGYRVYRY